MSEKFENQFHHFSKFGDSKSDGTTITLSQSDKWMKQAKVIDGKMCTTTDTGIAFKKFKTQRLGLVDYTKFIDELAAAKKLNADHIRKSMTECGAPGTHSNAAAADDILRMRIFDDMGHIRGLEGRSNYSGVDSAKKKGRPINITLSAGSTHHGGKDGLWCGEITWTKTPAKVNETVARLTDPKNYTGSSKLRFDEQGKGKGIEGRVDRPDESGYVSGYKHKDTFGKTPPTS